MPTTPTHLARLRMRVISALAATMVLCAPALADEAADISQMLRSGQHAEALAKAEAVLKQTPREVQIRFLKGLILAEQNRTGEAIAVFAKLAEDHPTLPEPLNNLGVLYAANGQLDKARAAFDAAIRTQPAYAAAYDNLGDVHARLATQAYNKALKIDAAAVPAKPNLALMRNLNSLAGNSALAQGKPAPLTPPSRPTVVAAAQPTPAPVVAATPVAVPAVQAAPVATPKPAPQVVVAKPEPKPAPQVPISKPDPKPAVQVALAKPEPKALPQIAIPKPEAKPASRIESKPEPKPEPKAEPRQHAEREEALHMVHAWARAWSGQDVKTYLGYYGPDFQTPNGQARKTWEEDRRNRIAGKGRISVKVESPEVSVNGNAATVRFRQIYTSDRLTANTRKTLVLARHAGKWLIRQEQTGG